MSTRLRRATDPEMMDAPEVDDAELARSLHDLRGVNRWLGPTRVVLRRLGGMLLRLPPGRYRVLDVATGSADIPLMLARWAGRRGIDLEIEATDLHPRTLAFARARAAGEPKVRIARADALDLPYGNGAFHFCLCSTALHHFDARDAVRVLREMGRVASLGLVVNDLRRSRAGLLGARLLAATVWRGSRFTRHDGPLSVRRAYTPAEVRALAGKAGLAGFRVRREPVFRLSLTVHREQRTPGDGRPGAKAYV